MVSEECELVAFDAVAKVFDREEDGQELAVKNTVFPLSVSELPREESYQRPSRNCSSIPPTALSDASTVMLVFAFEWG